MIQNVCIIGKRPKLFIQHIDEMQNASSNNIVDIILISQLFSFVP